MISSEVGKRDIIARWPEDAREAAQAIIQAYGEPDEYTPSMLIWYNNGPWKKTIVYRQAARHDFPFPHVDRVEQFIDHEAPMEKACEMMAFNGSVAMYGTKGELSSCCRDEPANFLSLNLARDIIQGKKTFHQARSFFAKSMLQHQQNKPVPYMEKLQFGPQENTIDPDESVIKEKSGRSGNGRQK
jgi:hypothetical protein